MNKSRISVDRIQATAQYSFGRERKFGAGNFWTWPEIVEAGHGRGNQPNGKVDQNLRLVSLSNRTAAMTLCNDVVLLYCFVLFRFVFNQKRIVFVRMVQKQPDRFLPTVSLLNSIPHTVVELRGSCVGVPSRKGR